MSWKDVQEEMEKIEQIVGSMDEEEEKPETEVEQMEAGQAEAVEVVEAAEVALPVEIQPEVKEEPPESHEVEAQVHTTVTTSVESEPTETLLASK